MVRYKDFIEECGFVLFGTLIYSIGTYCFIAPAMIAPGGAGGIALMVQHLTSAPVGAVTLLINMPLLMLAALFLSRKFAIKTAVTCVLSAVALDIFIPSIFPYYTGDRLLSSLYGGVLLGVGMACVFLGHATTGGSDIVGYLLQKKFPHISIGKALMIVDGLVLSASILVFDDIDAALFGLLALYVQNKVIDSVLFGFDVGSKATIITTDPEPIVTQIIERLDRSATILHGVGGYSGKQMAIIICVVRKSEFSALKRIVHHADPAAFVMATDTNEVFGLGFKEFLVKY